MYLRHLIRSFNIPETVQKPDSGLILRPPCSSPNVEGLRNTERISSSKTLSVGSPRKNEDDSESQLTGNSQRRVRFGDVTEIGSLENISKENHCGETNDTASNAANSEPSQNTEETFNPEQHIEDVPDSIGDWLDSSEYDFSTEDEDDLLNPERFASVGFGRRAEIGLLMQRFRNAKANDTAFASFLALYGKKPRTKHNWPVYYDTGETSQKPLFRMVGSMPPVPIGSRTRLLKLRSPRPHSSPQRGIVTAFVAPMPAPPGSAHSSHPVSASSTGRTLSNCDSDITANTPAKGAVLLSKRTYILSKTQDKVAERVEYQYVAPRACSGLASNSTKAATSRNLKQSNVTSIETRSKSAPSQIQRNRHMGALQQNNLSSTRKVASAGQSKSNSTLRNPTLERLNLTKQRFFSGEIPSAPGNSPKASSVDGTPHDFTAWPSDRKEDDVVANFDEAEQPDSHLSQPSKPVSDQLMDEVRRELIVNSLMDKFLKNQYYQTLNEQSESLLSSHVPAGEHPGRARSAGRPLSRKTATSREMKLFREHGVVDRPKESEKLDNVQPEVVKKVEDFDEETYLRGSELDEAGDDSDDELRQQQQNTRNPLRRRRVKIDPNAYDLPGSRKKLGGRPMIGNALVMTPEEEAWNGCLRMRRIGPDGQVVTSRPGTALGNSRMSSISPQQHQHKQTQAQVTIGTSDTSSQSNLSGEQASVDYLSDKQMRKQEPSKNPTKTATFADTTSEISASDSERQSQEPRQLVGEDFPPANFYPRQKLSVQLKDLQILAEDYLQYCLEVKLRLERRGIAVTLDSLLKSLCPPLIEAELPAVAERLDAAQRMRMNLTNSSTSGITDARIAAAKLLEKPKPQMNTPFKRDKIENREYWNHYLMLAKPKKKPAERPKLHDLIFRALEAGRMAEADERAAEEGREASPDEREKARSAGGVRQRLSSYFM